MARYKLEQYVPQGRETEERLRSLELYVGRMSQELEYVLTHLDGCNVTSEERERMTQLFRDVARLKEK